MMVLLRILPIWRPTKVQMKKICRVSRHGLAVGMGRGEAAVIVRYLEYIQSTIVSFVEDVPDLIWATETPANYVDELIYAKLEKFKYLPSGLSSDSEFVRRIHLDLTGLLPNPVEVSEFLVSSVPDKRSKLIDKLLETEEFTLFWTQKWGDVLKLSARQMGHGGGGEVSSLDSRFGSQQSTLR